MVIAIVAVVTGALFALCILIYRRSEVQVQFGILAKGADGGDYVIREVRELPFVLRDKMHFGLVFTKRGAREFMAQVVHYLPERPRILQGSIQEVVGVQTARGYEIAGPILKYVQGGVRVLGLNEGDPLGRYELDLFIDGRLAKTVRYGVVSKVADTEGSNETRDA